MRVYLDVCCLNRPFDDQSRERIRLESEAVMIIFFRIHMAVLRWVSSDIVSHEVSLTREPLRRSRLAMLLLAASETMTLTDTIKERATILRGVGFRVFDALHLAMAEHAQVDVFLTTDDRLLKVARRAATDLRVPVENPLQWILTEST